MNPKTAGFIRCRCYDAPIPCSTNHYWLPNQLRSTAQLNGDKERVHVSMQYRSMLSRTHRIDCTSLLVTRGNAQHSAKLLHGYR